MVRMEMSGGKSVWRLKDANKSMTDASVTIKYLSAREMTLK